MAKRKSRVRKPLLRSDCGGPVEPDRLDVWCMSCRKKRYPQHAPDGELRERDLFNEAVESVEYSQQELPSTQIVDLFEALKNSLRKDGQ